MAQGAFEICLAPASDPGLCIRGNVCAVQYAEWGFQGVATCKRLASGGGVAGHAVRRAREVRAALPQHSQDQQ
jgi:hypothetical protein